MVNLAQFDKNLIELPPETPQAAGSLSETRAKANSNMQYKSDGEWLSFSAISSSYYMYTMI